MRNLHTLVNKKHVIGLTDVKFDKDRLCSACEADKITKKHHSAKTIMTTTRPLELLHMDLFGPQNYVSLGGNKYCLVIVNDFSRYTWVFFLDDKSKVVDIFKSFCKSKNLAPKVLQIGRQNSRGTNMVFEYKQIIRFLENEVWV